MKFWKSLKSSSGAWTKGPSNGSGDDSNGSIAAESQNLSSSMRLEHNRNGNSSQLHSVSAYILLVTNRPRWFKLKSSSFTEPTFLFSNSNRWK